MHRHAAPELRAPNTIVINALAGEAMAVAFLDSS